MKKRIGEKSIRNLEAPEAGNRIDWDDKLPGFGVRITASGVTSFILDYYVAGRRRRYTIGRHPPTMEEHHRTGPNHSFG